LLHTLLGRVAGLVGGGGHLEHTHSIQQQQQHKSSNEDNAQRADSAHKTCVGAAGQRSCGAPESRD
jgi:hypothetical protein